VPEQPVLLDGPAIALALGIRPGVIRIWAVRGKLKRHGRDHRGRALFDLSEAYRVQAAQHPRGR
jgi:hypothetical protein